MSRLLLACAALLAGCCFSVAKADTGLIIPSGRETPDPATLAIEAMDVSIVIDNGHAAVALKEVFSNRSSEVLEGAYSLALPNDAAVSDFAVWDGLTRIPGVILERKRAAALYEQIRNQAIDPGLLESAEVSESNAPGQARHSTAFSVKIVPIPAYGYKRIEASYRQTIQVAQRTGNFVFPLKASSPEPITVGRLSIRVELRSELPVSDAQVIGNRYGLRLSRQAPGRYAASSTRENVRLDSDLEIRYALADDSSPRVTAYRSGDPAEPGYFEAAALLESSPLQANGTAPPRNVVVLFDASLSMQWDKLERSFGALEGVLRSLRPQDTFNTIVFNSQATPFAAAPAAATPETIARSLDFVRAGKLRGGTNLETALTLAFAQCRANSFLVLLSDGEATDGTIARAKLMARVDHGLQTLPAERRPRVYALAVGDDANAAVMRQLAARGGGAFEQVNSTEPLEFKLAHFVHEIGLSPLTDVALAVSREPGASDVYRLGGDNYPGSRAAWVGEYGTPGAAQFTVTAHDGAQAHNQTTSVQLPARDTAHEYLPPTWARARVDALLEKIDREGEDKATIDEIIRLSRKYHFVTPYTSFLAAPRALLRPRLIRPGDPMLRVRTDAAIASVTAMFPFGLVKPLRYLAREDIWQTRFLAPADMSDGAYAVRLILRDREGRVYQERKSFLISSQAPVVRVTFDSRQVHAGSTIALHVQASATTRSITARLYGAPPLALHWSETDKSNTGRLTIPASLPPGRYAVHVTAEDIAHNVSYGETPLEILP